MNYRTSLARGQSSDIYGLATTKKLIYPIQQSSIFIRLLKFTFSSGE